MKENRKKINRFFFFVPNETKQTKQTGQIKEEEREGSNEEHTPNRWKESKSKREEKLKKNQVGIPIHLKPAAALQISRCRRRLGASLCI